MMQLPICRLNEVPAGSMKQFDINGHELIIAHINDRFYCLDARCTHAGAPLAEGDLNGDILTCPWHYSQFVVSDGSVLRGPANASLKIYETIIKDDQLFVVLIK
jgi:nitrite reductase/ring-hydroxylating ferredoxin subunit